MFQHFHLDRQLYQGITIPNEFSRLVPRDFPMDIYKDKYELTYIILNKEILRRKSIPIKSILQGHLDDESVSHITILMTPALEA